MAAFETRLFGNTGMRVGPLGIASSYGVDAPDVERAYDGGVRFFLWGSIRKPGFGKGVRNLARTHRDDMVIAVQSYTRVGALMGWSVDRALRSLQTDYVDVLTLSWWNGEPPRRIIDAALALKERGKVRAIMVSCHHRPTFQKFIEDPAFDALMVRYNAGHPGAEREVFPHLATRRPAVVSFTATRWGTLLDPKYTPAGERTPRASDCYRFALTNPNVDVCLSGPKNGAELDEALEAVKLGPLDEEELAWMRRVGAGVRDATAQTRRISLLDFVDRLASYSFCGKPKQLASGSS
jgi:aryl-alcohol dehydrogenase-like predicted oxidoreductase